MRVFNERVQERRAFEKRILLGDFSGAITSPGYYSS
jgi:hypothetical protein